MRTRGVLAVKAANRRLLMVPEQRRHLDTFAALVAIALERVHYVDVAQQALIRMESERLRNSLLAALSHDLRTPLAAVVGLAESLELTKPELSGLQRDTAQAIVEEARRMNELVNNLLDMARIESGDVRLRREWHSVEEVVGSALKAARSALTRQRIEVALPPDLPLVEFDGPSSAFYITCWRMPASTRRLELWFVSLPKGQAMNCVSWSAMMARAYPRPSAKRSSRSSPVGRANRALPVSASGSRSAELLSKHMGDESGSKTTPVAGPDSACLAARHAAGNAAVRRA
jgi:hypothetical protein